MKTRTSNRPALCWSMVNGSTCLCYECWSCRRKMKYHTKEIAKTKDPDLTAASLDAAVKTIAGTARSMGIETDI